MLHEYVEHYTQRPPHLSLSQRATSNADTAPPPTGELHRAHIRRTDEDSRSARRGRVSAAIRNSPLAATTCPYATWLTITIVSFARRSERRFGALVLDRSSDADPCGTYPVFGATSLTAEITLQHDLAIGVTFRILTNEPRIETEVGFRGHRRDAAVGADRGPILVRVGHSGHHLSLS